MTKKPYYNNNILHLGDHLYYSAFGSDNPGYIRALVNTTKDSLDPYFNFLNQAIKAEEKRGNYEIMWKRIESKVVIRLNQVYNRYKITKPKPVLLLSVDKSDLRKDKNRMIYDETDHMEVFTENDIVQINGKIGIYPKKMPIDNEQVRLNYNPVDYEIIRLNLNDESLIVDEKNKIIKYEEINQHDNGWDFRIKGRLDKDTKMYCNGIELKYDYYQTDNFEELFDGDQQLNYEKMGNDLHLENLPISKIIVSKKGIEYEWYKVKNEKSEYAIQLTDNEDIESDKPISDYFFDDTAEAIYQGYKSTPSNTYNIKQKKPDDKILVLQKPFKGEIQLDSNQPIKISVNLANLYRQKEAVKSLNETPVNAHKNLIKLFQKKNPTLWKNVNQKSVENWYVLKDLAYDGTSAQRKFVEKAISTPDFAFLEGPPGSGKTTVIIELILQLLTKGFKILLSASTHVAIDNVLERIKEYDTDDIVEPLRIGDVARVDDIIKKYQIDEKINEYQNKGLGKDLAERFVIDSANLVCGTTMGIQQHPYIRQRDKDLPINPVYDYLIIDESSKTTFQEFLVPALHAKKWILVGDIKQLSPYIEQTHIVHNFESQVNDHTKSALRIVFESLHNNQNPYAIEVSSSVIKEIDKYILHWENSEENPYKGKNVSVIGGDAGEDYNILKNADKNKLFLFASDLILIRKGRFDDIKSYIPKTHILILDDHNPKEEFYYQQQFLKRKRKLPSYKTIDKGFSKTPSYDPREVMEAFKSLLKEKSWADEITWRMIRVYERRMLKNPDSYYEKTFKLLKPVDKGNMVDRIYNMTLPSILESLQIGNGEIQTHKSNIVSTTITEGFDKDCLKQRHEMLNFQHRMHPDISKFSREEFYTADNKILLEDSKFTAREWLYNKYPSRAVWIDIPKKDTERNDRKHKVEAVRIIKELKDFIKYANSNEHPETKPWSVAIITFYRPQEAIIREELRNYCNQPTKMSRFSKDSVSILNYTVDKFQGMEADIVFLSMVRGRSIGFLDNINRLNVALTRARYQRVILGDNEYFKKQNKSEELKRLAENNEVIK